MTTLVACVARTALRCGCIPRGAVVAPRHVPPAVPWRSQAQEEEESVLRFG